MNPSIFAILLHLGGILKDVKDLEQAVSDLAKKNFTAEPGDIASILDDTLALVTGGVINIPGITGEQLTQIVSSIKGAL